MKYLITLVGMTIAIIPTFSQAKFDNNFVLGNQRVVENIIVSFEPDTIDIMYKKTAFSFARSGTCISDKNGKLALYFNGCQLADGNHNLIEDGFNPGYIYANYCPPKGFGYIAGQQSNLILPIPEKHNEYVIFHNNLRSYFNIDSFSYFSNAYYSIIDASDAQAKVLVKNKLVLQDTSIGGVYTAVKHKNAVDWWVIIQDRFYTNGYYKILISKDTIHIKDYQNIGLNFDIGGAGGSQACFSPDGTKYITFNSVNGLFIMDFERESGLFTNFRHLSVLKDDIFNGCCFSPNG